MRLWECWLNKAIFTRSAAVGGGDIAGFTHVKLGAPGPGEFPDCADYGTGTLEGDTALCVNDLLAP